MRCAVVGCGLAGLGAAWALRENGASVDLYDSLGACGGASGIAAGLLHPYPGKRGLKTKFADLAMEKSLHLIDLAEKQMGRPIANREGILRFNWEPEVWYPDLVKAEGGVLITSGLTLFLPLYLQAIKELLFDRGCHFYSSTLEDENAYDQVLYAIGGGFRSWDLPSLQFVKGQILTCVEKKPMKRSLAGLGHISPTEREGFVYIGSTYEHHAPNDLPDIQAAIDYLSPRISTFAKPIEDWEIVDCQAAVRVCIKGSYLPLVKRIDEKRVIFTGLGSRGLLYHALYGERAAEEILSNHSGFMVP